MVICARRLVPRGCRRFSRGTTLSYVVLYSLSLPLFPVAYGYHRKRVCRFPVTEQGRHTFQRFLRILRFRASVRLNAPCFYDKRDDSMFDCCVHNHFCLILLVTCRKHSTAEQAEHVFFLGRASVCQTEETATVLPFRLSLLYHTMLSRFSSMQMCFFLGRSGSLILLFGVVLETDH